MTETRFTDLPLSDNIHRALEDMGYERPTPVQASAIPLVATGRDLMVQSQTGTGKTAAFGIPVIEALGDRPQGIRALALCPTRELARQVAEEFNRLGKHARVRTVAVYGGASLEKQIAEMRFAQIVVGTPGRVLDHLRRRTMKLDKLSMLVLDEADEMLSMGFAQEINAIMQFVPGNRQTLLFSATIPEDIKRYARRYMKEPEFLSLIEENVGADDVEHHYYMVSGVGRPRELVQVIEYEEPESAIIFTNTRQDSELVARYLKRQGYNAEYLNGDLPQRERERVMQLSKEKNLRFLCATDIAARGIDISELSHVINYILPESPEVYIHRTGRTGRAGSKGTAISLIGPREIGVYYYLKRIYNVALQERTVPTQAEIELRREERRTDGLVEEILGSVEGARPDANMRAQVMRLLERDEAVEVVQALLMHFNQRGAQRASGPKAGGVLDDVPRPERTAPGSRPVSVSGVADRVALITSAHRGPAARKAAPAASKEAPAAEAAAEAPAREPALTPEPTPARAPDPEPESEPKPEAESTPEAAPEPTEATEESPPRRRRRPSKQSEPQAAAPAEPEEPAEPEAPKGPQMSRVFVSLGERDGYDVDELRDTLAELGGLLPEDLRDIEVNSRHSFVTVEREFAEDLIAAVNGETLDDRSVRVEFARNG